MHSHHEPTAARSAGTERSHTSRREGGPAGCGSEPPGSRSPVLPSWVPAAAPAPTQPPSHLEVEDAGVAILKALAVGHHAVQEGVVEGEGGDGGQEPAVPCGGGDPISPAPLACPPRAVPRVPGVSGRQTPPLAGKPQESGRTGPSTDGRTDSQGRSELAGGRGWGRARRNGQRSLRTPEPARAYPGLPGRCRCGWPRPR